MILAEYKIKILLFTLLTHPCSSSSGKQFKLVKVTLPTCGSYSKCDRRNGRVNHKYRTEVPDDWIQCFREPRRKPSSFSVVPSAESRVFRKCIRHFLYYIKVKFSG